MSKELKGHEDEINVAAFSPSGSLLATGAVDGVIKVWSFDDLDIIPKSRKMSSNHYVNYAEFNQSETLLLVNVVSKQMVGMPTAIIVIVSVMDNDLPLVCAFAEPLHGFHSTWYSDTSFLGTMKFFGTRRLGIWKCEVSYCVDEDDTNKDDIVSLCDAWKEAIHLFDIECVLNDYRMVKVLDVDQGHTDDDIEEKLVILYNVDMRQPETCGIYLYQVSRNLNQQKMHYNCSVIQITPILLKAELCLGLWLSPDKRFITVNTRLVESVDLDVMDEGGRLESISYSEKITLQVYDLSKSMEQRMYHENTATNRSLCYSLMPSANEHCIASGTEKGKVLIWDHQSTRLLYALTHIQEVNLKGSCLNTVNAVTFHPKDPEVLVSVADDKTVKVWKSRNRMKTKL